jgi:hypothetical protein
MSALTVHRLSLQFEADRVTHGNNAEQAAQTIDLINRFLKREPFGLSAQLIATRDEIEVEPAAESPCEACDGDGWVRCNIGNDQSPQIQIQRCDACEKYGSDEEAQEAAMNAA